ncbi:MAG TPA: DUF3999 domain-containing protein [Candidatus Binatia bacterium]|nr:DUF3999 domain-containing protein [Candidatus Binatia bacterium]
MKKLVVSLMLAQSLAAAAAERPQDYAYGIPIDADSREALHEIEIPAALYRGVSRNDLGDIRVFNGQGEVVPHALRPRAVVRMEGGATVNVPVFPLRGLARDRVDDLNVRIAKRADGTIVSIQSRARTDAQNHQLRGYWVDASAVKQPIQALNFDWKSSAEGFVGKVKIEGSDNLAAWATLVDHAALARLTFGGYQLNQDRVELPSVKQKYLRVTWPDGQAPLESLALIAEPAASMIAARRVWQPVAGAAVSGKAGEYIYDLGGAFPFDRLRVELPQVNTLAQSQILARHKTGDEWRLKTSAVVYRLRQGDAEVTSPEITLTGGERYLLLRVDQKGGGLGTGVPALQMGWIPQKLVFAARAAGPFQLAYGSGAAKAASYPIESLIPGYNTEAEFKVKPASLGDPVTLAGAARLRAPMDYKKWAVWIILILGVAVLGWMAYRLSRQTSKPSEQSEGGDKSN